MPRTAFPRLGRWVLAALALVAVTILFMRAIERPGSSPVARPAGGSGRLEPYGPTEVRALHETPPEDSAAPTVGARRTEVDIVSSDVEYSILLVDRHGDPIAGAMARTLDRDRGVRSDGQGRLRFKRAGARGLVVADGFEPRTFEVPRGRSTLELCADRGLELRVVWEDTGEGVAGARVERVGLGDPAVVALLDELLGDPAATDAEGRIQLHALRVDNEVVRLRIHHPQAAATWQELGALLEDAAETPRLDVLLPRVERGARFRVLDTAGNPLADRRVRVSCYGFVEARTDADGRATVPFAVRNVDPEAWNFVAVSVELQARDSWWWSGFLRPELLAEETELRVAPVHVRGRVRTTTPEAWQVASANLFGSDSRPVPRSWPDVDQLTWSGLDADGVFDLPHGWQGANAAVFLRTRGSASPILAVPLRSDGASLEIEAPATCSVEIEVLGAEPEELVGATLHLDLSRKVEKGSPPPVSDFARLEPLLPFQRLFLPEGSYLPRLRVGSVSWILPELQASAPHARAEVPWPKLRRLPGTVRGTLSGPVAGAEIRFFDHDKLNWGAATSDLRGHFEADLPGDRRLRAFVMRKARPGDPPYVRTGWAVHEIDPDQVELHIAQPEAELTLVERPHQPLLAEIPVSLLATRLGGSGGAQMLVENLGPSGRATWLVEPDAFVIRRSLGEAPRDVSLHLVDGERREVLLDTSDFGPLALEIHFEPRPGLRLSIHARDRAGRSVLLQERQAVDNSPRRHVIAVAAGSYDVGIALHDSEAATALPAAEWSGVVEARPGRSDAEVIQLR
jgi:hypothetical protein